MSIRSSEAHPEDTMASHDTPKPKTRRLQVDVRPETIDALKAWARSELKPMAVVVRQILEDAVADRETTRR